MSDIPSELKYTKSHEWVRLEADGSATIGISDSAQELLGDLVFVELPEVDGKHQAGDDIAVVESVKAAADVYSPLSGTILEVNEALSQQPELINSDSYGKGWLFKMSLSEKSELNDLLDANEYAEHLSADEEV